MGFQLDIKDDDSFRREVLEVPGVCQVVELYPAWCGPCKAIQSTFKRIYFDAGDRPLKFFTADADKLSGMEEHREKNQPVFLFYKDGKMIDHVVGVVAPQLERKINQYSAV
ncbi:flagellar outer dynein arm light chain 5, thioredoxin-like protein [Dunaliella salina]|uniref:Flagellar outer dynein arm light chain 5, thioredoxin-like protein n=1 Tax=Dunaliella salina TaxID=3046 RepID=A0ABQ7G7L1_DUNSA|nr:flagellar outer dynein arm light chain 5, thioredoxin-like protein [Dunaliella salina]|eukprot:KAF5830571.1 flagellar outer dynein arm light chain 5, thioredoxin-like protein [Dunaliella salina]